jgi:hypothetical protein
MSLACGQSRDGRVTCCSAGKLPQIGDLSLEFLYICILSIIDGNKLGNCLTNREGSMPVIAEVRDYWQKPRAEVLDPTRR